MTPKKTITKKKARGLEVEELLNRTIPVLTGIYIFFNPFPHTTTIKEVCYYSSAIFFIFLVFYKKKSLHVKNPMVKPFGLFVFWAFLSIFFALDKENSVHDFFSHLIKYVILYLIIIDYFCSVKRLVVLSKIVVISVSIFSAGAICYYYSILKNPFSARLGFGVFVQSPVNIICILASFALILSLINLIREDDRYQKAFLFICLAALSITIFLTQTRSAFVAIFLALTLLLSNNKKIVLIFLLVFVSIVFVIPNPLKERFFLKGNEDGSVFKRANIQIGIAYIALEVIKDHPFTGVGFGMQTYGKLDLEGYNNKLPEKKRNRELVADPHNIVLDIAVRLGLPGLVFFMYIIFVFLKMNWFMIKNGRSEFIQDWGRCLAAAFVAVFGIGLFQPIFSHMPEVVICIILSMTTILWKLNESHAETSNRQAVD